MFTSSLGAPSAFTGDVTIDKLCSMDETTVVFNGEIEARRGKTNGIETATTVY